MPTASWGMTSGPSLCVSRCRAEVRVALVGLRLWENPDAQEQLARQFGSCCKQAFGDFRFRSRGSGFSEC